MPVPLPGRALVTVAVLSWCGAISPVAVQSAVRLTKDKLVACQTRHDFEEFAQYLMGHDVGAARQMLRDGTCLMLPRGAPVYVEEAALDNNMRVRIRPRGSRARLWTDRLSITSDEDIKAQSDSARALADSIRGAAAPAGFHWCWKAGQRQACPDN